MKHPIQNASRHGDKSLALLLFIMMLCAARSFAQDTFQQQPWQRNQASRSPSSRIYKNNPRKHYLDDENWMTDKRNRLWDIDLLTRKPNEFSWTTRLLWTNVIAYGAQVMDPRVTNWGVKLSERILQGQDLYRLLTPVFLHGSWYHLWSNMYSLNRVGVHMERLFGPGRYLAGYLVSGAAGNLLSAMMSPNPALGASGAVFGAMGGFYVFLSRHDWLLGRQGEAYSDSIIQTLFINIVIGAFSPMVDNWAHAGGAIGGAAMAYYFGPRLYLVDMPDGGRAVVDRPIVRLPRYLESIPENTSILMRRMQIWRFYADMPWRSKKQGFQKRRSLPNRSLKPKNPPPLRPRESYEYR
jgi:membrane associated rhomboid family serine protease